MDFNTTHRNISEMPYYGAGPESVKDGRSNYRVEDTNVELRPGLSIFKGLRAAAIGSYLAVNAGPGHSSRYISTDLQFGPETAPGINHQANFWRGGGFIEYDWRDRTSSLDATSGGKYGAQYVRYFATGHSNNSFLRFDLDAEQYIPLFNHTRVVALRAASSLTTTRSTEAVPFYLQPTLGGPHTLRGYRFNRFYGDNSTMVSGEYRWHTSPLLQVVAFADAGKVFNKWENWNFHDLESAVGFGFRFRGRRSAAFSFDTGFSHEGFEVGTFYSALDYIKALRLRTVLMEEVRRIFETCDVLMLPAGNAAPKLDEEIVGTDAPVDPPLPPRPDVLKPGQRDRNSGNRAALRFHCWSSVPSPRHPVLRLAFQRSDAIPNQLRLPIGHRLA